MRRLKSVGFVLLVVAGAGMFLVQAVIPFFTDLDAAFMGLPPVVVQELPTPDGKFKAVIAEKKGSATTKPGYRVYIEPVGSDAQGNEVAHLYGATRNDRSYGVNPRWTSNRTLRVEYFEARFVELDAAVVVLGQKFDVRLVSGVVSGPFEFLQGQNQVDFVLSPALRRDKAARGLQDYGAYSFEADFEEVGRRAAKELLAGGYREMGRLSDGSREFVRGDGGSRSGLPPAGYSKVTIMPNTRLLDGVQIGPQNDPTGKTQGWVTIWIDKA